MEDIKGTSSRTPSWQKYFRKTEQIIGGRLPYNKERKWVF